MRVKVKDYSDLVTLVGEMVVNKAIATDVLAILKDSTRLNIR